MDHSKNDTLRGNAAYLLYAEGKQSSLAKRREGGNFFSVFCTVILLYGCHQDQDQQPYTNSPVAPTSAQQAPIQL